MPRPNALDISPDNARHFVESNVESVWPPCRVLLSLVERCRDKFEQVQNCRVVTLDISIVSSVVEGCRVRLARLSTFCSTFANQRMRNMQYFEQPLSCLLFIQALVFPLFAFFSSPRIITIRAAIALRFLLLTFKFIRIGQKRSGGLFQGESHARL